MTHFSVWDLQQGQTMFLATSPWLSCGHTSMCLLGNRREAELEVEQKGYRRGKSRSEALGVGYQSTLKAQEALHALCACWTARADPQDWRGSSLCGSEG